MPPKNSSPRRVVYRTIKAKELAEKRAEASRLANEDATDTDSSSVILQKVLEKWDALPERDQTPARAIILTAEACNASQKLTDNPTYTGAVKLSRELPFISQSVLELYTTMRSRAGVPVSEGAVERALFPEYATNISFTGGSLKVVTNKYVGMEYLPGTEAVMKCDDDDNEDDETPRPCDHLTDLIFNCLKLKLCTLKEIKEFVSQEVWEGASAYLLSSDQVMQLIHYGIHEQFDASALEDSIMVTRDCENMVKALYPTAKRIKWEQVAEGSVTVPKFTFEEEEYYACD